MADDKQINTVRRSTKRKLEDSFTVIDSSDEDSSSSQQQQQDDDLLIEIRELIEVLEANSSDRALIKRSIQILSELAKNEDNVNLLVGSGIVPALVKHLQEPQWPNEAVIGFDEFVTRSWPLEHEVEKASAFTIGLLAIKPEHQQLIVDAGALPHLVALLKRHRDNRNSRAVNGAIRKAADAITNLAHENSSIKTRVRVEGGIPPLVELLESNDAKVQRAAAGALRTLAFKNDENKTQIVDHNALPTLVLMLQSEDTGIHYEAVGVIGNLVHSSPKIKMDVLDAGALQPVIKLLSSTCSESQREAALLLGQFAAADSDSKVHIVQRGAVVPLIEMLKSPEAQLREMSAFALGRLAQDTHNQAGIAHSGGIVPLLKLLDSKNGTLQHNGAFTLYGLADNEDNVADLICVGGVQQLMDGEFIVQPTRDCVAKTLKRIEEKIHGKVLNRLLYKMHNAEKIVQRRIVLALAHLCSPEDQEAVFVDNNGLDLLLELLQSVHSKHQGDACAALCRLAEKATSVSPVDAGPSSPISQYLKQFQAKQLPILERFALLLTIAVIWAYAHLLTASGAYKHHPEQTQMHCRTDKADLISAAPWIKIPYPLQWGAPTFDAGHAFGMMAAVLVSLVESTGAYKAAARLASATPPPAHFLSRGIGWQGIGILLSGLFGTATGSTVSVENVGLLGSTRVGSRRVIQISAGFMIFFSILGKFGALFASIPFPIFAAAYCVLFGLVASVGLSFLQFTNMNSMRNLFIVGVSFFLGLSIPEYFREYTAGALHGPSHTKAEWFNDFLNTIFFSSPTVALMVSVFLDNTLELKDSAKDRGMPWWAKFRSFKDDSRNEEFYTLPFNLNRFFPPS